MDDKINCFSCGKNYINKDEVGLNKKFFGRKMAKFYCIECLSGYLGVTIEELLEKIEEFKEQGCGFF
jgi:hypothetical protein